MKRAIFLDRDGTIIRDGHYLADPAGLVLLDGVVPALRAWLGLGLELVVVSNQSGLARGIIRPDQHDAVHARFVEVLREHAITLRGVYYCVHGPDDGCACRKPLPGMIHLAARQHDLDLSDSWMIGDKASEVAAGHEAGCRTALLGAHADARADVNGHDWASLVKALADTSR